MSGRRNANDMNTRKSSLVDYSKISNRPEVRQASSSLPATVAPASSNSLPMASTPIVSAQMDAVMRLMTGREERTIAEKLADSNRPTWEQYKKDNHAKLNLDTLDQKQMEEYRKQLDEERDRRMAGLSTHDSSKKHAKKKKHRKKKRRRSYDSDESIQQESSESSKSESSDDNDHRRRRKHKKHAKHHEKKSRQHRSRRENDIDNNDIDDETGNQEKQRKKNDDNEIQP